jgi:hypothetical protein
MLELAALEEDEAQRDQASEYIAEALRDVDTAFDKLEVQSLLSSEMDSSNAYLTLHAAADYEYPDQAWPPQYLAGKPVYPTG